MKLRQHVALEEYISAARGEVHQAVIDHILDDPDRHSPALRDALLKGGQVKTAVVGEVCWATIEYGEVKYKLKLPKSVIAPHLVSPQLKEAINKAQYRYLSNASRQALKMVMEYHSYIHDDIIAAFRQGQTSDDPENSQVTISGYADDFSVIHFVVVPSIDPPSKGNPISFSLPADLFDNSDELNMDLLEPIMDF